jgi:heavy metal sensor kinase
MRLPIRARLALVSGLLVAILLAGMAAFLYLRLRDDLFEAVDRRISTRLSSVVESWDGERLRDPTPVQISEAGEAFVQVVSAEGRVIRSEGFLCWVVKGRCASTESLVIPAELAKSRRLRSFVSNNGAQLSYRTVDGETVDQEGDRVPVRVTVTSVADDRFLLVGESTDDQHEVLDTLMLLLVLGAPVAAILAGGIGWVIAGAALRPVERMRVEAAAISASEPGRRLPVPGTRDELARLGETLNRMLERLEQALERERRFVDEASHELRTPLANLRAELELALRRARTPDELLTALRSAAEESQRLTRLAEDLLILARADGGKLQVRREDLDVAELIGETVGSFSSRATERGISLERRVEPAHANVDATRMRQAIGNLIDNALLHTPSGGRVSVELDRSDDAISIKVSDTGEGFPPSFLPRAFEAFSRADAARARSDGGTGLGLAIVKAVIEAHGGSVNAANTPTGGAVVTLRFPA